MVYKNKILTNFEFYLVKSFWKKLSNLYLRINTFFHFFKIELLVSKWSNKTENYRPFMILNILTVVCQQQVFKHSNLIKLYWINIEKNICTYKIFRSRLKF